MLKRLSRGKRFSTWLAAVSLGQAVGYYVRPSLEGRWHFQGSILEAGVASIVFVVTLFILFHLWAMYLNGRMERADSPESPYPTLNEIAPGLIAISVFVLSRPGASP